MLNYLTGGAWDPHDFNTISLTCDSSVQFWDLRTMKYVDFSATFMLILNNKLQSSGPTTAINQKNLKLLWFGWGFSSPYHTLFLVYDFVLSPSIWFHNFFLPIFSSGWLSWYFLLLNIQSYSFYLHHTILYWLVQKLRYCQNRIDKNTIIF